MKTGCVLWPFVKDAGGYGAIKVGGVYKKAHRVFYEMFVGPIPVGHGVLHTCDTPACVNPLHLRTGTHSENMADCAAKGRRPHGEQAAGAKLTAESARGIYALRMPLREIASRFGVSKTMVHNIKRGRRWRHAI